MPGPSEPATHLPSTAAGDLSGDAGRLHRQLPGPVGQVVLRQHPRQAAEAVGLHHVASHVEEASVQVGDDVGPGVDQDLVASLEVRTAEIVGAQVPQLKVGAGRTIEDHDPLACRVEIGTHRHRLPGGGGPSLSMFPVCGPDGLSGSPRSGAPFGPYFGVSGRENAFVTKTPTTRRRHLLLLREQSLTRAR